MPLGTTLPYGLRDIKLTPFTSLARTAYAGASIDLPNAQTFTFTETEDYEDLRGDDRLITSHGKGPVLEWDLESGGVSLDAYAAMAGGTIIDSGVTPNQIRTYRKLVTDVRPFFKVEGQAISDSGGDFHGLVYAARATKDIKAEFKDGAFLIPGTSGVSFGSLVSGQVDRLYDFIQNETITNIP